MAKGKVTSSGSKVKSGTKIQVCSCISSYQDLKYGASKRVHNNGAKGTTCTVCGKVSA